MRHEKEGIKQIRPEELLQLFRDQPEHVELIDCREPEEYEAGHIPGIKLVPMGEILEVAVQWDRNRKYVFVCRSGRRSHEVCKFLKASGFERVINFDGGMLAWEGPLEIGKSPKTMTDESQQGKEN